MRPGKGFASTAIAIAATLLAFASARAADLALVTKAPPPAGDAFWAELDVLAWTVKGDNLPALITTSPAGTPQALAGALGTPGTTVLFGDSVVNDGWRAGARIQAGYWLDGARTRAVEVSFFDLDAASTGFAASSNGSTILARPFVDANSGASSAQLVAFPGLSSGATAAHETSRLLGAGALYRREIASWADAGVSALVGYRYLHSSDRLDIASAITVLGGGAVPVGTGIAASDAFDARSDFHGLDLGVAGELRRGPWIFEARATVALGANLNQAQISGSSTLTLGGLTTASPGGLLALTSNIGSSSQTRFAVVPELRLKAGYQLTPQWRLVAGYDVLYWSDVQRAGGLIDSTVNPNLLPAGSGAGPQRPQAVFATSPLLAQGFSLGARYGF
jgi:Putative beta barrel porin-7 (BBP7)